MSAAELHQAVAARRKVAPSSVPAILDLVDDFTWLPDNTWALSPWEVARNAPERPRRSAPVRKTPTMFEETLKLVPEIVSRMPGGSMRLADLIDQLMARLHGARHSFYQYVNAVEGLEKFDGPDAVMVRIVALAAEQPLGTVDLERLIAEGESSRLEFKSSLRWSVREATDMPVLQKQVTKSIAALANGDGGRVLVGVQDDGSIFGIEKDCEVLARGHDPRDAFLQALGSVAADHCGGDIAAQLGFVIAEARGGTVCVVQVRRAVHPVYHRDGGKSEFYVRIGTLTRALAAPEIEPYIRARWG
jgi:hypothetical protein